MTSRIFVGIILSFCVASCRVDACTAFSVFRNGRALVGNNEDFWLTDTKVWYAPSGGSEFGVSGKFGRVYFGFSNLYAQGGMNEAGLFFDGFATEFHKVRNSAGKKHFDGNLTDYAMANCETVEEVIALFKRHDLSWLSTAMLMFADKGGDSVIIEGDDFVRIDGDYQIATNFYQSLSKDGPCPCQRFATAKKMLGAGKDVSLETCVATLAATCQKKVAPSVYSNVYDLEKGLVHLYHFQDFDNVVVIELKKELQKGPHQVALEDIFPHNERRRLFTERRLADIRKKTNARRAKDFDNDVLPSFVGVYIVGEGVQASEFSVSAKRGNLLLHTGHGPLTLVPERPDGFFRFGDYGLEKYVFSRNKHGVVEQVEASIPGGRSYTGKKRP